MKSMALLLTNAALPFATGQRIIVTGYRNSNVIDTPMMRMLSSSPLDSNSYISAEPPCRSRRLEPFRQHVREECRLDAATYCPTDAVTKPATTTSTSRTAMLTPTYTNDVWMNSLMESIFETPASSSSSIEDSFESKMNSMLNEFFEHMMDLDVDGTPELAPPAEQKVAAEAPIVEQEEIVPSARSSQDTSVSSSSEDIAATPLDEVAENSLDVLVATLAQRFVDSEDEDTIADKADANLSSSSQRVESFSTRLSQLGNDLLSETRRARRRRLQEASTSSGGDGVATEHQMQVKERLARRLTEYRTDLVYHPGGRVTVYTSSFQPHSSSLFSPHAIRAFPSGAIVSPLGMGSNHVDECMKSRYENGDLGGSCFRAVDRFFAAVNDRSLSPPSHSTWSSSSSSRSDEDEPWYYDFLKYACLGMIVALPIELYLCLSRKGAYALLDRDGDDEGGDSFDYEIMREEGTNATDHERGHQEERKEKVPRVYLGVPVQVV